MIFCYYRNCLYNHRYKFNSEKEQVNESQYIVSRPGLGSNPPFESDREWGVTDSPSIINYLEPLTGDVFRARFANCHFDEVNFPSLGGDKLPKEERCEIIWNASSMSHLDPRTAQCEKEVRRITHL